MRDETFGQAKLLLNGTGRAGKARGQLCGSHARLLIRVLIVAGIALVIYLAS